MIKNKLKSLRAEYDLNQDDMAEFLGIRRTTYHNKETGKSQFTVKEAVEIAKFFNATMDDIFHS